MWLAANRQTVTVCGAEKTNLAAGQETTAVHQLNYAAVVATRYLQVTRESVKGTPRKTDMVNLYSLVTLMNTPNLVYILV